MASWKGMHPILRNSVRTLGRLPGGVGWVRLQEGDDRGFLVADAVYFVGRAGLWVQCG